MDVVYSHVYGLDVHKKNIVACTKETRTFGIMTDDLILLVDWLKLRDALTPLWKAQDHTGNRSTILLELEDIEELVVNAQHIKNVPGWKTDIKDAEWIAGLLRHGLLKVVSSQTANNANSGN